ncbi:acyclic terpene utilization AtuA family protein [Nocardiopsis synnemataformans]|uniref:acyclic terpene utilization AtuA family protein n=1 Tax=Nocardiopsis synnemataformans TaxID=61305 RepID=UPI003EBE105C
MVPARGVQVAQGLLEVGLPTVVAAVSGDDVLDLLDPSAPCWEDGLPLEAHGEIVSANAYVGADALTPALEGGDGGDEPFECRLRVAALAPGRADAEEVAEEVGALYTSGPSGGGGVRTSVHEVVGVLSTTVDREAVRTRVDFFGEGER